MLRDDLLLRTRLTPPRSYRRVLARPGLLARLVEAADYRLTVVQAGTGYGKTTALAALAAHARPLVWYALDESDRDPQQFLAYLIAAFRLHLPDLSDTPLALLGEIGNSAAVLPAQVIDALLNALAERLETPALLVMDDYHFVAAVPEIAALTERFLAYLPSSLHVILATRHPVSFPAMTTWRARGELLEIGRRDLAFRPEEVAGLFRETYGMGLAPDEVATLYGRTEGWPIALQLAWQGLRSGAAGSVADLLAAGVTSSTALFDYLARETLDRQPPEIAAFLRETAVLGELTPAACDAVRERVAPGESAALLARLHALDLFVVALGDEHYRYHHLFHDFLRAQSAADPAGVRARHRRAGAFFQGTGDYDTAIPHWLAAHAFEDAAAAIEAIGESALRAGRLSRVADWIDALPPPVIAEHPRLQAYLGDLYRLRSLFDRALAWYAQAEAAWRARDDAAGVSRALRGQASVYLDTVRPARAEHLLVEALRLAEGMPDREARARLLEMLAENKLNLGKPAEAETLRREAQVLRDEAPTEDALSTRVKVRTGQLAEARRSLQALAAVEERAADSGQIGPPRAHRETALLLSLVEAFMGLADQAIISARTGIELGERLESPFITAVGRMRLGHALQLAGGAAGGPAERAVQTEAITCYRQAIALGDRLAVRRTGAEALWGLTRIYGYGGDLELAARTAAEGLEIADEAGDAWIAALITLAMGASHVLAGKPEAASAILTRGLGAFRECNDTFGRAASRLWLSLAHLDIARSRASPERGGALSHFLTSAEDLLALCEAHGYDFLFTAPSLSGPPDVRRLVPLLLAARSQRIQPTYVNRLLAELGLPDVEVHPGYQLRVQTLGAFRVWRGNAEVAPREWQRDKARQLFQLLLTDRTGSAGPARKAGRWLQREEIVERLWPRLAPEAAARDFKVALNALNRALEPGHTADAGAPPPVRFVFVVREGTAYRLRPEADLWVDAGEFTERCERGLHGPVNDDAIAALREGLRLYAGDYLPEAIYEDWATDERERLLTLYLRAADRLAGALVERGQYEEGLDLCQAILGRDVCWEHAYRLMMIAYARQGNRGQAHRAYARCVEALRAELDVPPSAETVALFRQIGG
jgi:DNA-binding SARP family transcriptional activator